MELSEENTYPLESSTGITIINVSAQLQGLILIAVSGFLDTDLVSSDLEIQVIKVNLSLVRTQHIHFQQLPCRRVPLMTKNLEHTSSSQKTRLTF